MKTEPNESASPIITVIDGNWIKESPDNRNGLTKREHFAAMAMQGLISQTTPLPTTSLLDAPKNIANWSVIFADELINALNKKQ